MDGGEDQLVGGGTREGGEARGVMHDASACNACAARGCMRIAGVLVEGVTLVELLRTPDYALDCILPLVLALDIVYLTSFFW